MVLNLPWNLDMANNITIDIPAALRPQAGNLDRVTRSGDTIGGVLDALCGEYPELGKRLFKAEGQLNRFINVYVNDEDIRFLENLDTRLKDGDSVSIVPAIAGG